MEHYVEDLYEFLMEAVEAERIIEEHHHKANWLAAEETDLE